MTLAKEEVYELMKNESYTLSSKYDPDWIIQNELGSHCLWLAEALAGAMELKPGMRILDMGCGKAITSIFLAKEFGLEVWANDLWISPTENWLRIQEAGVGDKVYPLKAEAHSLPYADEFFDAIISINALQFFGTCDYYMKNHFGRLVKPGGQIGIIVPGLYKEFEEELPEYLRELWQPDFYSWHSAKWWERHWKRTGMVDVLLADNFENEEGRNIFLKWEIIMGKSKLLNADKGRNITFVMVVAPKNKRVDAVC
ncbi:MAG: methyltransferase domain-containing protein [Bacillota bacterium]